jgi:hypothetical protein
MRAFDLWVENNQIEGYKIIIIEIYNSYTFIGEKKGCKFKLQPFLLKSKIEIM